MVVIVGVSVPSGDWCQQLVPAPPQVTPRLPGLILLVGEDVVTPRLLDDRELECGRTLLAPWRGVKRELRRHCAHAVWLLSGFLVVCATQRPATLCSAVLWVKAMLSKRVLVGIVEARGSPAVCAERPAHQGAVDLTADRRRARPGTPTSCVLP